MKRSIIHVDMDMFYAAVEVRDNPDLAGRPLIIGALPDERGVVSTCSYEARKYGVHSAMSIKDAYRRCPQGIYMHPDMPKYKQVSDEIHRIWNAYTDIIEYVSLDEGYLDATGSMAMFGSSRHIAEDIKRQTMQKLGLTCSVGIGYSMTSAKFASEEKKPDGLFEVLDREHFVSLIRGRGVRIIYGIGQKTADKLEAAGIATVRDIQENRRRVIDMLGRHGQQIVELADGIDNRSVTPYYEAEAKSIGRERTFQQDITDTQYLKDVLVLLAKELSVKLRFKGIFCRTITLKVTYADMKALTRSKSGDATNRADVIYGTAAALLDAIDKQPIRLVGISLGNLSDTADHQLSLDELDSVRAEERKQHLDSKLLELQQRYGTGIIKTGHELKAEQHIRDKDNPAQEKE